MRRHGSPVAERELAAIATRIDHEDRPMGFATGNATLASEPQLCLGIDPGLQRTGYALLQRSSRGPILIEGGIVRSTASGSLAERVTEIGQGLREILEEFSPDAVAIEQVFSHVQNPKTAILMAHARGAILYAIASAGLAIIDYSPRQVKKLLTGSGRASKEQIQHAVKNELQLKSLLEPNDVADACAIALCHYHSLKMATMAPAIREAAMVG